MPRRANGDSTAIRHEYRQGRAVGISNRQALQSSLNECFALFAQLRTRPPDSRYIKRPKKMALATLPQAWQIACFLHHYAPVAASPFPILSGDR